MSRCTATKPVRGAGVYYAALVNANGANAHCCYIVAASIVVAGWLQSSPSNTLSSIM
jgi:hypothetical protein